MKKEGDPMKAPKSFYVCSECDYRSAKWMGKCPGCGAWNTMQEQQEAQPEVQKAPSKRLGLVSSLTQDSEAVLFDTLELPEYMRSDTGLSELDRVLGGGLVLGSVVLLSGEPGIGKSTLLLQICDALGQSKKVLYVSGEESQGQLKLRAKRLGVSGPNLYLCIETDVRRIMAQCDKVHPDILIVDSIQTMYSEDIASTPGSVTQVKETAMALIHKAKNEGISVLLVGHVNQEGSIAGPKVLEHMVDAVLYFEGERQQSYRIIRAIKNRYGSTNEIGVFEMAQNGMKEVENPSLMMLSGRPKNTSGTCVACTMEGSRPILAEVQGLVTSSGFGTPRRMCTGFDYNRMSMIIAVLEKRAGYMFGGMDAYLNVIGGLKLFEPAADLSVAMALVSSLRDKVLNENTLAFGEIGLAGEIRAVNNCEQRINEAGRLGFTKCIIPFHNYKSLSKETKISMDIVPVRTIRTAFDAITEE